MDEKNLKTGKHAIEHWQIIAVFLAIYDFVAVCAAYFLALLLRFHFVTSQRLENHLKLA